MRVLQVMATGQTSGGANHLLSLVPALVRLGVTPVVAVGNDGPLAERFVAQGIETHTIDLMGSRLSPRAPVALLRLLKHAPADVVHYHGTRAAFFGALARRVGLRKPSVYTVHGLSYRKARARGVFLSAEWLACRSVDHVISVSGPDLDDLVLRNFVPAGRTSHIPNAIDTTRFLPRDKSEARARLGLDPEAFVVGTVSRLVPGKAVHDLLNAATLTTRPMHWLIVGDGPERQALERHAKMRNLAVTFVGERDDVPELLAAMNVFALPSHWEGEPVALLEALAVGIPCVATDTVGAVALLRDQEAGQLVPVGDPQKMADALEGWASLPSSERERRGKSAVSAMQRRDVQTLAQAVLAVYRKIATASVN